MANTTILLRDDIEALGGRGEIVKVRAGYARNYLLPHGLATLATKGNVKQIEQERTALLKRAAEERSTAEGGEVEEPKAEKKARKAKADSAEASTEDAPEANEAAPVDETAA